jgi:predicted dienelactone hydrolase
MAERNFTMLRTNWILIALFVIAASLLSACQPVSRPTAPEAQPPQGLRPDAPAYAVHGPYAVGTRDFVIKTGDRTTPITIWYPALNPEGRPEETTYTMDVGDQGLPQYPVLGHALLDAPPDMSSAPYPLVVWSHGAYLYRQTNAYLAEHLASEGFVVVAGNHEDNWGTFPAPNVTSDISRPADISAWIDFAEEQTAAGSELAGLIDTEHVAAAGHSYGGYTALAAAGALYNPTWYLDVLCVNNTLAEDDPLNSCSALEKSLDKLAALAGLDGVPEGLWPSWQDPRVDAIFLLAPSSSFGPDGSAAVKLPAMSLTGSADPMQDVALNVYLTHDNLGSAKKSLVVFQDGGHTMFLNDCHSATGMAGVAFEWCSDAVWDMDRVHDLVNHFATAFLLSELKGDAHAAATLASENVSFPGIEYKPATDADADAATAQP